MGKKINIAFIGLGEHQCRAHVSHLAALGLCGLPITFAGAYDPNPASFEKLPGSRSYSSAEELLADPSVDAVFIASPDRFHADQLLAAVTAGKHTFCEKPMAVTAEDIEKLNAALAIAQDRNLVVSTCHPRRFDPPFIWLKNELPLLVEKYGRLKHFDFSFFYHEVVDEWKKTERKLLSDHFGHEIDIFRFLFGESSMSLTTIADSYDYYEATGATLPADGGDVLSFRFSGSRNLEESVYKEAVRLDFEKCSVYLHLNAGEGLVLPDAATFPVPEDAMISFPKMDYNVRFVDTNVNFIQAILAKTPSYLTHNDIYCNNSLSVELSSNGTAVWASSAA